MEPVEFPVALNPSTPRLDKEVLKWAWSNRLFLSNEELEKARIQKLNWFASYLFPEAEEEVLRGTMKFFLWLFLIDDLLDSEHQSSARVFLDQLQNPKPGISCGRFDIFLGVLSEIKVWWLGLGDEQWQKDWHQTWNLYLDAIRWEFQNKRTRVRPSLSEYQSYRMYFSGVYLAIHLLRLPDLIGSCESDFLESKIARLICLSNDLSSAEKENQIGDYHNEMLLLIGEQDISPDRARTFLNAEIKNLFRDIKSLSEIITKISIPCSHWTRRLNLLLGGCLYWASQDTNRYNSSVNGHSVKF